ncbi:MAG: SCO family protein [Alysiella sp.]|uniref:SCO family protein n=1 Tax=Alysiella sp. TaxID=1872483 RepID=UPI0026DC8AB8|nr:SCO family protein [Alysiella sp.]MDO4434598.1 SCO family protein [Alysiella sp.]
MHTTLTPLGISLLFLTACNPQPNSAPQNTTSNTLSASCVQAASTVAHHHNHIVKSTDIRQDKMGGDFTLTDKQGKPFSISNLKGNVVILAFGFTNCPDVCPTELFVYSEALKHLGKQADKVKVVFVSVDPERDTPDLINRYVQQFSPDFIGLTDTQGGQALAHAKQLYQIVAHKTEVQSDKLYNVDHSAGAYLLDKNGNAAYFAPYGIEALQLAEDLKQLLAE